MITGEEHGKALLELRKQDREIKRLRVSLKGILAALTQPKTFPADVDCARGFARQGLDREEEGS